MEDMDYGRLHQKQLLRSFQDNSQNSRAPLSNLPQSLSGKKKILLTLKQFLQQDKPLSVILIIALIIFLMGAFGALLGDHTQAADATISTSPLPSDTPVDTPFPTFSPTPSPIATPRAVISTPRPTATPTPTSTPIPSESSTPTPTPTNTPSPTPSPSASSTPIASDSASLNL